MLSVQRASITGIVLCGGGARRMGGIEKPLQLLDGSPLVQHVRERLAPQVGTIVISANREHARYAQWGDAVIADDEPELGPLGGLATVLPRLATPWFFCCPGDAPFIDLTLVERLGRAVGAASAAIPSDGQRAQHLFLLGSCTVAAALHDYLARGERAVGGFVTGLKPAVIDASDIAGSFRNINSLAELSAASRPPR